MPMELKARFLNSASSRYCVIECGELDINVPRVTVTVTESAALLKPPTLAAQS